LSSFFIRFNLTEKGGHDGSETDDDDSGRPSFLSIQKSSGALDKELAASGFTKKEQVEIEKVGEMLIQYYAELLILKIYSVFLCKQKYAICWVANIWVVTSKMGSCWSPCPGQPFPLLFIFYELWLLGLYLFPLNMRKYLTIQLVRS
jgi:hypothetical protein